MKQVFSVEELLASGNSMMPSLGRGPDTVNNRPEGLGRGLLRPYTLPEFQGASDIYRDTHTSISLVSANLRLTEKRDVTRSGFAQDGASQETPLYLPDLPVVAKEGSLQGKRSLEEKENGQLL